MKNGNNRENAKISVQRNKEKDGVLMMGGIKKKEKRTKETGKTRKKFDFRHAGIATKLCLITAVVLLICTAASDQFTMIWTSKALHEATDEQFYQLMDEDALKVESIFQEFEAIVGAVTNEMSWMYSQQDAGQDTPSAHTTNVTGNQEPLTNLQEEAETVILNTIWAGMKVNENLEGVGVLFEPYAFSSEIGHYAPYGVKDNINNGTLENISYDIYGSRDYYNNAKGGTMSFRDMYTDPNGTMMYSMAYPMMYNGEFKGVVLMDMVADIFETLDERVDAYPSMYIDLVRNDAVLYSTRTDTISSSLQDLMQAESYQKLLANLQGSTEFRLETKEEDGSYVRYGKPIELEGDTWWVMATVPEKEYAAALNQIQLSSNLFTVLTIVVLIVWISIILKKMLKPLEEIENAANAMAEGSLRATVQYESHDEIGSVAESMRTMMRRTDAILTDIGSVLDELANENFCVEIQNKEMYVGDYAQMAPTIESIVAKLNYALTNIRVAADQVGRGAQQVAAAAQDLSQGSTEQAATVEELSAALTEIYQETKKAAGVAGEANQISNRMGQEVVRSNEKMREMAAAMQDITQKSGEIEKIIKTIDDIAFQTNILALNAAVEAARAGSAGKGFAVVADEVRNLAQKSAEAAQNTTTLIEGTIASVANGGRLTEETEAALHTVSENVEQVTELVSMIAGAAREQADNLQQTSEGIAQISAVVQTNSATAEECAATSQELSGQVNIMNSLINRFRLKEE